MTIIDFIDDRNDHSIQCSARLLGKSIDAVGIGYTDVGRSAKEVQRNLLPFNLRIRLAKAHRYCDPDARLLPLVSRRQTDFPRGDIPSVASKRFNILIGSTRLIRVLLIATMSTIPTILGATCSVIPVRLIICIDKVVFVLGIVSMMFRQAVLI